MTAAPPPGSLDRRFEALLFGWEGTAVRDPGSDATELRRLVEALCSLGAEVAICGGTSLAGVDGQLRARPAGPGTLHLLLDGGAEVYRVDGGGPRLVCRRPAPAADEEALDPARWFLSHCWRRGIGPGLALVAGVEMDPPAIRRLLEDQLRRRVEREVPALGATDEWVLTVDGLDPTLERAHEALLTLADGRCGTSGAPPLRHPAAEPRVLVAGLYTPEGPEAELLHAPVWNQLEGSMPDDAGLVRRLDLHAGLLHQELRSGGRPVRVLQFSSLDSPGTAAMRVAGLPCGATPGPPLRAPGQGSRVEVGEGPGEGVLRVRAATSEVAAVARDDHDCARASLDRLAAYVSSEAGIEAAARRLDSLGPGAFEALLARHRAAWAARWETADVEIDGDPRLTRAVRFALFHLMASVDDEGEAALGARGLTGPGYRGHVFWDSDVFVLPFLAATHPPAARAMLEYRVRRLPAARAAARAAGRDGARFPWESAATGRDVTPAGARDRRGQEVVIRTGLLEEHVVADVAWAARCYVDWSGDEEFERGPGAELLVETARYWASRIRIGEDGRAHIDGVIGPDEYHDVVDDDAYTNVMARWNLRRAARSVGAGRGGRVAEARRWLELAGALVDGYDPETGVYEQFAGFHRLETLLIRDVAPRRPIVADVLLGRERAAAAQVIKQPSVLMLHHLVPEETAPGSLRPNLDHYEPRTAHGSSLSPGIHAGLLARAGLLDDAMRWLTLASGIDLDDVTETTAQGLHVAAMGSVWQALVMGFAGVRPRDGALQIAPRLPDRWRRLRVRLAFRGSPLAIEVSRSHVVVETARPLRVLLAGAAPQDLPAGVTRLALP